VIFTSATLRVGGNFLYWKTRIGLENFRERTPVECVFPSPFPYEESVLVAVPRDLPRPDEEGYTRVLTETVLETLAVSEGRGLVLFTSYELLNRVYERVREGLRQFGIDVLKQGDDERSRLLRRFNAETSTVLFATDSFWEGVDSPGETLEMLILTRLPFRVPSEPITKARMARIEARGGNSFIELSLPDAIMRFRQGFGRLIRHQTDRGVVLILDSRVVNKTYGRHFLESLPQTRRVVTGLSGVMEEIERFFTHTQKKTAPGRQ